MTEAFDLHDVTILIVDDQPNNLRLIADYLGHYGAEIMLAHNGSDGLHKARLGQPDLILLDVMMPDMDGFEVCRKLQDSPDLSAIPVIFLTALGELESKVTGFQVGGVDYLTKPIQETELLARVSTHLKLSRTCKQLIESNAELRLAATVFETAAEAIMVTDASNQIVAVNPAFTDITGYQKQEVMGKNPKFLSSGKHDQAFYKKMWQTLNTEGNWRGEIWDRHKQGHIYPERLSISTVKDTQGTVINYVGIFSDITQHKQLEEFLRQQAHHDPLTKLPNRTMLRDHLRMSLARARRHRHSIALLYIDLDGFKSINDTLGHETGDSVLMKTAQTLLDCVRANDMVARLGGDEFIVVLDELTGSQRVFQVVERIISKLSFSVKRKDHSLSVSASIGIAQYPEHGSDEKALMHNADLAMYEAKRAGKNRYFCYKEHLSK